MRVLFAVSILWFSASTASADAFYKFIQFNCDETLKTLEITKVYAEDYPEFESLDHLSGVLKEDLGIEVDVTEYASTVKPHQFPREIAKCSLSNSQNEKHEINLILSDYHPAKYRGQCSAASGPAYEIHINNQVVARFRSDKDWCFGRVSRLDIDRLKYSRGQIELCRTPENLNRYTRGFDVRWDMCLYGPTETLFNDQDVMKEFERGLLDEANTEKQKQQNEINRLNETLSAVQAELEAEKSKSFWQRLFD